jgi:indolepyruvate ferredoxin oxidoreductase
VARLLLTSREKAEEQFEGDLKISYNLAPPILGGKDANGRPKKRRFGPGMERGLRLLAKFKGLRGTPLDIFGYTDERKMERSLIKQYERDMKEWLPKAAPEIMDPLVALAELPLQIRGFGPVKLQSEQKAAKRREELLAALRQGGAPLKEAAE